MKTIEERAKVVGTLSQYKSDYPYDKRSIMVGYIKGATDQKDIDDAELLKLKSSWEKEAQINHDDEANYKQGYHDAAEKACRLIDNYIVDLAYPVGWADAKLLISIPERLRKAMEE